jgi:hypothetical protein
MATEQAWADIKAFSELLFDIKARLRRLTESADEMRQFKEAVYNDITVSDVVVPNPRKGELKKLLLESPTLTETNVKATLVRIDALRAKIISDFSDLL